MSFSSAVSSTNEEDIDTLFGVTTPGADNLIGGVAKGEEEEPEAGKSVLPKQKGKTEKPTAQKPETAASEEDVVDTLFPGGDAGEDAGEDAETGKTAKKPTEPVGKKPTAQEFDVDYKALYDQLVKDGVWQELENVEDIEWNAETFKKAQQLQTHTQYEDLLDKTGPYGKAIIEFEKNGGNPGELLNLFREQRQIQDFDISDPEGQEEFLRAYYSVQDNSEKSIERMIKALQDQGPEAFQEEAEEKKSLWDKQYAQSIAERQKQQQDAAKAIELQARNFQKTINDALVADAEVTPKERKELNAYILAYDKDYQGKKVSQFYIDMSDIQKDPANYVELAKFIKGIKTGEYKKKVENKTKREVTASTFLKVKGGGALSRSGGEIVTDPEETPSFLKLLNRK